MQKKCLSILLMVFFLGTLSLAAILVEPSRFILKIEPGKRESGFITVINTGSLPADLKAVLYDWDLSETGELIELQAKTRTDSLDGLIKFNPRQFTIQPGKAQIVRFTIDAPQDGLEHKGVVFFEESFVPPSGTIGATVTTKVGPIFYVAPTNIELALQFNDIRVVQENNQTFFKVFALNNGKGHIRLTISYKLQTKEGKTLKEDALPEQVILPGKNLDQLFSIAENLHNGDYRLIVVLSYFGYTRFNEGVLEFSIP